jgi:chromosome segregation ATPase
VSRGDALWALLDERESVPHVPDVPDVPDRSKNGGSCTEADPATEAELLESFRRAHADWTLRTFEEAQMRRRLAELQGELNELEPRIAKGDEFLRDLEPKIERVYADVMSGLQPTAAYEKQQRTKEVAVQRLEDLRARRAQIREKIEEVEPQLTAREREVEELSARMCEVEDELRRRSGGEGQVCTRCFRFVGEFAEHFAECGGAS